jgi:hypothetical protein
MSMHDEASAPRARAWVYLLGAWHAGDDPSVREVRRVTHFGGGRAAALVAEVAEWAAAHGASVPERLTRQATGQERGRSGALAGQKRGGSGAEAGQSDPASTGTNADERGGSGALAGHLRGGSGAEAGQKRGASRARVPLLEREEKRDREGGVGGVADRKPEPTSEPTSEPSSTPAAAPAPAAAPTPPPAVPSVLDLRARAAARAAEHNARAMARRVEVVSVAEPQASPAPLAPRAVEAPPAPRVLPDTLDGLLGGEVAWSRPARALAVAGITPEVLVTMSERDLQHVPGVGGAWRVISRALAAAGWPLASGDEPRGGRGRASATAASATLPPEPGSPQADGEEWYEYESRKKREIAQGLRDSRGTPVVREVTRG